MKVTLYFKIPRGYKIWGKKDGDRVIEIHNISVYKSGIEVEKEFYLDFPIYIEYIKTEFDLKTATLKIILKDRDSNSVKKAAKAAQGVVQNLLQELEDEIDDILNP